MVFILPLHHIHPGFNSVFDWIMDLIMYIIDLSGLPDIITQIRLLVFSSIRPLSEQEKKLLKAIYKDSIDLSLIWLDPINRFGTKKFAHAYVFYNTINFYQNLQDDVLVHEAMHILQYQKLGSIYINRALKAQKSKPGYNYGGGKSLYHGMLMGKKLWDYNFEQQAQIIQDYYLIIIGKWQATPMELSAYKYYLNELQSLSE